MFTRGPIHPVVSRLKLHPSQISKAVSAKRAVNTTNVSQDIFQYLQPSNEISLGINIPACLPKTERGLNSHITARFLIPRQHLTAFEKDPDRSVTLYTTAVSTANHDSCSMINRFTGEDTAGWALVAEDWPTFLYDERVGWNERNIRRGLFQGHVLIRVGEINGLALVPGC